MGDKEKDTVQLTFEEEQELFRNIWRLWKEYREPDKSNYYWDSVLKEFSALNKSEFAADLIQSCISELGRREKCLSGK